MWYMNKKKTLIFLGMEIIILAITMICLYNISIYLDENNSTLDLILGNSYFIWIIMLNQFLIILYLLKQLLSK